MSHASITRERPIDLARREDPIVPDKDSAPDSVDPLDQEPEADV